MTKHQSSYLNLAHLFVDFAGKKMSRWSWTLDLTRYHLVDNDAAAAALLLVAELLNAHENVPAIDTGTKQKQRKQCG